MAREEGKENVFGGAVPREGEDGVSRVGGAHRTAWGQGNGRRGDLCKNLSSAVQTSNF